MIADLCKIVESDCHRNDPLYIANLHIYYEAIYAKKKLVKPYSFGNNFKGKKQEAKKENFWTRTYELICSAAATFLLHGL